MNPVGNKKFNLQNLCYGCRLLSSKTNPKFHLQSLSEQKKRIQKKTMEQQKFSDEI